MSLYEKFVNIVGSHSIIAEPKLMQPFLQEKRNLFHGTTDLILQPTNVQQISAIVKLAKEEDVTITPQGGNTGLVGGQQPNTIKKSIILSLSKLNKIRSINLLDQIATVEAGVILEKLQQQLQTSNYFFALKLASQGSSQIGGILATNAGGSNVLAHGMVRQLCLGLEVVLPDGSIINDLKNLYKDNSGYDIKDLFIGSEGTLGIITAASLKILPLPKSKNIAFIAITELAQALDILQQARHNFSNMLTAFELMPHFGLELLKKYNYYNSPKIFNQFYPWYILLEVSSPFDSDEGQQQLIDFCNILVDKNSIGEAIIAQNINQANFFWKLRDLMSEVQKKESPSIKHDISLPISKIVDFIIAADNLIKKLLPNARIMCFGHLGDGNLHYNILPSVTEDPELFIKKWKFINQEIHQLVHKFSGSFSAEHGVGQLKREEMDSYKDKISLKLMRSIKKTIDPNNIMNPNKIFKL
ncbi:FAD-binding oxidoreductase [Bartonella sp. DGB1]|uniref:FAD-binding oxidoreductase n=1 Tax=Bartonella sp. DGB1 TaxID=3239807 RepID=UPI003525B1D3